MVSGVPSTSLAAERVRLWVLEAFRLASTTRSHLNLTLRRMVSNGRQADRKGRANVTNSDSVPEHPMHALLQAELLPHFDELRRFIDRRIAELSAEVHATVQLVDFSEANLSGQLARIHDQIGNLV